MIPNVRHSYHSAYQYRVNSMRNIDISQYKNVDTIFAFRRIVNTTTRKDIITIPYHVKIENIDNEW